MQKKSIHRVTVLKQNLHPVRKQAGDQIEKLHQMKTEEGEDEGEIRVIQGVHLREDLLKEDKNIYIINLKPCY